MAARRNLSTFEGREEMTHFRINEALLGKLPCFPVCNNQKQFLTFRAVAFEGQAFERHFSICLVVSAVVLNALIGIEKLTK